MRSVPECFPLTEMLFLLLLTSEVSALKFNYTKVGGVKALEGEYPYIAFLNSSNRICTGVILERRWILTAAHCLGNKTDARNIQVTIATYNWTNPLTEFRSALGVYYHPSYDPNRVLSADFALIKVPPMRFGRTLESIAVLNSTWYGKQKSCQTMGLEKLWLNSPPSVGLFSVDVKAERGQRGCTCLTKREKKYGVCLTTNSFHKSCMWDTGGPLVCEDRLVGIYHTTIDKLNCAHFNPRKKLTCRGRKTFEVFTYMCPYLTWMREYIPSLPEQPLTCTAPSVVLFFPLLLLPLPLFY